MIRQRFPFLGTKRGVAITVGMLALIICGGLAGLAALHHGGVAAAAAAADDLITSATYFYGQSPPVYPSREDPYLPPWVAEKSTKRTSCCSQHDGSRDLGRQL